MKYYNISTANLPLYCVYLTVYSGSKLPPFYIGSKDTHSIITNAYRGSVTSRKYKEIWISELKNSPHLFKTVPISYTNTRDEALTREREIQIFFDVIKNPMFINMSYAKCGFSGSALKGTVLPEKTKIKISNALKGRSRTSEHKDNISKSKEGISPSTYSIEKMRSSKMPQVTIYDITYNNIYDAMSATGLSKSQIWYRINNNTSPKNQKIPITFCGTLYDSIADAIRATGLSRAQIQYRIDAQINDREISENRSKSSKVAGKNGTKIIFRDVSYVSISQASLATGLSPGVIKREISREKEDREKLTHPRPVYASGRQFDTFKQAIEILKLSRYKLMKLPDFKYL